MTENRESGLALPGTRFAATLRIMLRQVARFLAMTLAALGLVMGGAHVLELAPKMRYDAEFYMRVTSTLYRYFGLVGGPIQLAAVVAAAWLCWLLRGRRSCGPTLIGTIALAISLMLWAMLVQPVNTEWATALHGTPAAAEDAYRQLRSRWEYGHVAAFAAWFVGFAGLLLGVLADVRSGDPAKAPSDPRA